VRIATNPAGAQGAFLMWGTTPFRRFLMKNNRTTSGISETSVLEDKNKGAMG